MVYDERFLRQKYYSSESYKNIVGKKKSCIEIKYFRVNKRNKTGNVHVT